LVSILLCFLVLEVLIRIKSSHVTVRDRVGLTRWLSLWFCSPYEWTRGNRFLFFCFIFRLYSLSSWSPKFLYLGLKWKNYFVIVLLFPLLYASYFNLWRIVLCSFTYFVYLKKNIFEVNNNIYIVLLLNHWLWQLVFFLFLNVSSCYLC
jgi:hypothetical protein